MLINRLYNKMYYPIEKNSRFSNSCYICSGGRVAGVVIGVLAACAGIGVGIYCLCTRVLRKKKSADTHGTVIKHEEKTTWNKSKHIYYCCHLILKLCMLVICHAFIAVC